MVSAEVMIKCSFITGVPRRPHFDSIVYIDVLERIKDDKAEIEEAAGRLRVGGTLIVLSPAYNWLFTPFDEAIGHYRRYSAKDLRALTTPMLEVIATRHLDSVGTLASLCNKLLLSSKMPTRAQILFWDRVLVPIFRVVDPLLAFRFGKSIMVVWRRHSH
jgi:hypothetical protein